jgi:phosphoglucomutase
MTEYMTRYQRVAGEASSCRSFKGRIRDIKGNETEIQERFYQDLAFGTAGLEEK